ncbi:MAG: hypothetical protein J6U69_02315 [Alistipes sp.]|nr:hypothetical protein [Alistipes sp.]
MATLKISDLSVGDWVKASDVAKRVHSIEFQNGEYFVHFSDPDTNSEDYLHAPFIEPIPITAEILERNGIHRTYEDDNYAIFRGDGLWTVKYSDGDWELSTPPVCRVDIKYVHQLQHALRLAGVDKEINL